MRRFRDVLENAGNGSRNGIEALASLLGDSDHAPRYRGSYVPLHAINVLAKPRKTFSDIPELALDIALSGQLEPMIVAQFNRPQCERNLALVNRLWQTSVKIEDLRTHRVSGKRRYFVLVDGERRYRANLLLWQEGCSRCVKRHGKEKPGACFRRHFRRRDDLVEVRLCMNTPPFDILFRQLSGNIHKAVPPYEEAHAYSRIFNLVKQANPKFTLTEFAERAGRNPDTVRNALRFCNLPVSVQEKVKERRIPYGFAIELTRLRQIGLGVRELDWWVTRLTIEKKTVSEFHDTVTKYLAKRNSNQVNLLDVMHQEDEKLLRRLHIRKTVAANVILAIWSWIHYLRRVFELFEVGKLGKEDSPFSVRSPIRVFLSLIDAMERLHPHFRGLISRARYEHAAEVIGKTHILAKRVETHAKEDKIHAVN